MQRCSQTLPVASHHSASEASIQGYLRLDDRTADRQNTALCSVTALFALCSCNVSRPNSNPTNSRWLLVWILIIICWPTSADATTGHISSCMHTHTGCVSELNTVTHILTKYLKIIGHEQKERQDPDEGGTPQGPT